MIRMHHVRCTVRSSRSSNLTLPVPSASEAQTAGPGDGVNSPRQLNDVDDRKRRGKENRQTWAGHSRDMHACIVLYLYHDKRLRTGVSHKATCLAHDIRLSWRMAAVSRILLLYDAQLTPKLPAASSLEIGPRTYGMCIGYSRGPARRIG